MWNFTLTFVQQAQLHAATSGLHWRKSRVSHQPGFFFSAVCFLFFPSRRVARARLGTHSCAAPREEEECTVDRVCHVSLRAGMCLPDKLSNVTLSMSPTPKGEASTRDKSETYNTHITQHRHKWELRKRTCATRSTKHDTRLFPHKSVLQPSLKRSPPTSPDRLPFGDRECTVYRMCLPDKLSNVTLSMSPTQKGERQHETRVRRTVRTSRNTDTSGNSFIHSRRLGVRLRDVRVTQSVRSAYVSGALSVCMLWCMQPLSPRVGNERVAVPRQRSADAAPCCFVH